MKITRERKIIGAVLTLALAGLGLDQLSSSRGGDVADASTAEPLLMASASSGTSHKPAGASGNEQSLADRLASLASATQAASIESMRDVFHPTTGWIAGAGSLSGAASFGDLQRFSQTHKLSAVSTNGRGAGVAVVDGKLLHIGATVDGLKLIAISSQTATFSADATHQVQLKINNN